MRVADARTALRRRARSEARSMRDEIFRHRWRARPRRRASDDRGFRAAARERRGARARARGRHGARSARTRALSGYMFEAALEAGFVAAGVDVMLIGPLPTPGIAYLTQALRLRLRRRHQRLAQSLRRQRHQVLRRATAASCPTSSRSASSSELDEPPVTRDLERARPRDARRQVARRATRSSARRRVPEGSISRAKIVIDCANGAGYKVGPRILADLGAEIVPIGCSPNGRNINRRLRLDRAGAAAAHGAGRARARRHRARWRRRPARDGRSPRPHRRWRPAAVHHRARAQAATARCAARSSAP